MNMIKDCDLKNLRIIEPDFKKPSDDLIGQIRFIGKIGKYRIFSSVQKIREEVSTGYNPFSDMLDILEKPRSYENHQKYFNAYMDLLTGHGTYTEEWNTRTLYSVKLIGKPIYSWWYPDLNTAMSNADFKLNELLNKKLQKRADKIVKEVGAEYIWTPSKAIFDSKNWCVAPIAKYKTRKYELLNDLEFGCQKKCLSVCKNDAINFVEEIPNSGLYNASIDHKKCIDCGDCAKACPNDNIGSHAAFVKKRIRDSLLEKIY